MLDIKSFLSHLPDQPGVYQMLGEKGNILYIGKARNLKKRVSNYFLNKQQDIKTTALVKHIHDINIIVTHSETEALLLESNLIKKHQPHYNVLFRDDKSYPYILITTDEEFPRIDFYRGSRKRSGLFFGPFPNATTVRQTIHLIGKLFQLRTCTDSFFQSRTRPCLHYQIGRCSGPCGELISKEDYAANVRHAVLFLEGKNQQIIHELTAQMETAAKNLNFERAGKLRDQIRQLREIQTRQHVSGVQGEADVIGFALQSGMVCIQLLIIRGGRILGSRAYFPLLPLQINAAEILTAFITQHYLSRLERVEDIPKQIILDQALPDAELLANALSAQTSRQVKLATNVRGERKKWLEIANNSAAQSLASHLANKANVLERMTALKTVLQLSHLPERIECFDISHSMGEATVGSCVVFNQQGAVKSDYRRFNITDITPGDDVAAMRQTLLRRYKKVQAEEGKLPDILLIDGGKTQFNAAEKVLAELNIHSILLVSVAKGPTRKPGFETIHLANNKILDLSPDSLALHFMQQIRDEAHRFAITGHRMRRDKKRRVSALESIPGIGAHRRRELLRYFGGIQAINRASLEELAKVPGISQSLAKRIFDALHNVI